MRKQNRILLVLMVVLIISLLCAACTGEEASDDTSSPTETDATFDNGQTEFTGPVETTVYTDSSEPTEPAETTDPPVYTQGRYSLEDCMFWNSNIYFAYEDGSFDLYPTGGYCSGLSTMAEYFDGMYLPDSIAERIPTVNRDTDLVVFSDEDYSLHLYRIHAQVDVYQTVSNDGVTGYGRLSGVWDYGARIIVEYEDNEDEYITPLYLDGESAKYYDAEYIYWTFRPYPGAPSMEEAMSLWGFKGDSVTLGVGEGTSLVETTFQINAKYYECSGEHWSFDEKYAYVIEGLPTTMGYATVDLSGVPDGTYVMVFEFGKHYRASLLKLQNG